MEGLKVIAFNSGFDNSFEMALDLDLEYNEIPILLNLNSQASNSDNSDEYQSIISNWDISQNSYIIIPEAENLINIQPDNINITGTAEVTSLNNIITIIPPDNEIAIEGSINFTLPYVFQLIDETSSLGEFPPDIIDLDMGDGIDSMAIQITYNNTFDFM